VISRGVFWGLDIREVIRLIFGLVWRGLGEGEGGGGGGWGRGGVGGWGRGWGVGGLGLEVVGVRYGVVGWILRKKSDRSRLEVVWWCLGRGVGTRKEFLEGGIEGGLGA
jgi:hypothetical protein